MSTPSCAPKPRGTLRPGAGTRRVEGQDGQILVMSALLLVPLLIISALAIDIGALQLTGQGLQASSDLAALAGAQRQGEGADRAEVEAEVDRALVAAGIDLSQVTRTVSINAQGDVSVDLQRWWEPVAFGSLIVNGFTVHRNSTATSGACISECRQSFTFSPEIPVLPSVGSGDGYRPLVIGDTERVMTMNHHLKWNNTFKQVVCVDVATLASCPGYPLSAPTSTGDSPALVSYEPRGEAWYALLQMDPAGGQARQGFGCIDEKRAALCGEYVQKTYPQGYANGTGYGEWRAWGSNPHLAGTRLFATTEDLYMMCFELKTRTTCPGYPKRPDSWQQLADRDLIGFNTRLARTDRVEGDSMLIGNKFFISWPVEDETVLLCWNTDTNSKCSDFGDQAAFPVVPYESMIFDIADSGGNPKYVCVLGPVTTPACFTISGAKRFDASYLEAGLPDRATVTDRNQCQGERCWGRPTRVADRLFLASFYQRKVYCVDLKSGASCGTVNTAGLNPYALTKLPNRSCLIGGSHQSYFFSFSTDTLGPCGSNDATIDLLPCECLNGTFAWGQLAVDPKFLTDFKSFEVFVRNKANVVIVGPVDLVATGGVVDLSDVDPSVTELQVKYNPVLLPSAEWKSTFNGEVQISARPSLID